MTGFQRPHCLEPGNCTAKKPTTHCVRCTVARPDIQAKRIASIRLAFTKPDVIARKRAAAQRVSADPEVIARRTIAMTAAHQRPDVKARHKRGCLRAAIRRCADPAAAERMREMGRTVGIANLRKAQSGEVRARAANSIRAAHLAWCPEEYWPLNAKLKAQKVLLPERKAIIAAKVAERADAHHDHTQAADFLRRFSAVYRCSADGRIDPVGTHWRYGTRVLERLEIVRLAVAKGWTA